LWRTQIARSPALHDQTATIANLRAVPKPILGRHCEEGAEGDRRSNSYRSPYQPISRNPMALVD
jgi:hypothetical protein